MLITQGSEDRALLLAPSRNARTVKSSICLLGLRAKHLRMMLVMNIRMKIGWGAPLKEHIQTTPNLPNWSDVYD